MLDESTIEKALSKTFASKFEELIIDVSQEISYNRREMIEMLGCANFLAAYRLSKVLKRLKIHTPRQLFNTDPFSIVRAKGIGETSIYVAMCILDANKFDVLKWWGWNATNTVKFSAFKHNAIRRARSRKQEV